MKVYFYDLGSAAHMVVVSCIFSRHAHNMFVQRFISLYENCNTISAGFFIKKTIITR